MQKNSFDRISTDVVKTISKNNNEPTWMLDYRLDSLKKFHESSFEQSNLFKKYNEFLTDLDIDNIDFKINSQEEETEHRGRHINFLQINGEMVERNINDDNGKAVLIDINEAIKKHPDIVQSYIKKNPIRDKFEYLSDALFQTGLFIHIPKDTQILDTIRYINRQENSSCAVFNKNLIVLDDNSVCNLFIEHYSSAKPDVSDSIFGYSKDIFVSDNSELTITEMELFNNNIISFMNKRSEIGKQSKVKLAVGYLGGKVSRSRSYSNLTGNGSEIQDLHLVVGTKEEKHDLVTSIKHSGKNTKGSVDVKGVLTGKSYMTLKGMNKIENQAFNADTFLGGHAILLGKHARANIIPGLEIDNRNVQAKHSAAVAPIDEDLLFYLQSRALDKNTAVKIIVTGFLESILKRIEVETIREQIEEMVEFKFKEMVVVPTQ